MRTSTTATLGEKMFLFPKHDVIFLNPFSNQLLNHNILVFVYRENITMSGKCTPPYTKLPHRLK